MKLSLLMAIAALVLVGAAAGAAPTFTTTSTATSITLNGLNCGTRYRLRVQSYNPDGTLSATTTKSTSTSACAPPPPPPPAVCADGLDNDGDGLIDYPADPGCSSASDTDETDVVAGSEPAPIAGQGYSKVWGDEFDSFTPGTWDQGIWYNPGNPAGSTFVQNGVLNLVSKRSQGYQDVTVTTEAGTSPHIFTLGYFEARMRWTKGAGAWPAFWLLSYRHATNPAWPSINPYCAQNGLPNALCYSAELDVFEGQGTEPTVFYGTSHRNSSGDYGVNDSQNQNNYFDTGVDLTAGFHDYAMLWTSTTTSWYLDGRFLMSAPVYDSTNQPQFVLFDMFIGGWAAGNDPNASTPDELKLEVDWVHVWQHG